MMRFNDGSSFDPTGEYRIERRRDGLYVLGGNMMFAVDSYSQGIEKIRKLNPKAEVVLEWDKNEEKRKAQFFYEGRKYRIVKDGAYISGWTPTGAYTSQGWNNGLQIGDIVTYRGMQYSGGSDGIHCQSFSVDNQRGKAKGIFWPNDWGRVDKSFFEIVE